MKKGNNAALVLIIIVIAMLNADQYIMNATLGPIEEEFGVNDAHIGLMSGLFTFVGAAVSLVWGYLSDKYSRKKLFVYSVLIGQIPCFLTAFSSNYTQFFIFRIPTGIGVGASFPIIFSMLGDMYGEKSRAAAVTWLTTFMGFGQVFGQMLGGYLGPVYGWRLPFIIVSVPNLIVLVLFGFLVDEPRRGANENFIKNMVQKGIAYPRTIKFSDYLELVKIKTNVYLFIQGILGMIPWGAVPLFFVEFLNENKGLSVGQATTAFLLFGAGMTAGTIVGGIAGGWLLKRKTEALPRLCALTTLLGSGIALFMLVILPPGDIVWTFAMGFVSALCLGITGPNMKTMLLSTNVPENRGAIFSLFNLADSAGSGIGKFFAGILSFWLGLKAAISISVAMWIPCAMILWLCASVLASDIKKMKCKMKEAAREMKLSGGIG